LGGFMKCTGWHFGGIQTLPGKRRPDTRESPNYCVTNDVV
jgi:hypothetical protein